MLTYSFPLHTHIKNIIKYIHTYNPHGGLGGREGWRGRERDLN